MLRFFRQFRQRLLTENRFSKYLLYAMGEIVLVVVGILIALSINNLNQERLASINEKELLSNIVEDLKYDHEILHELIQQSKNKQSLHIELYEKSIVESDIDQNDPFSSEILELIFILSKTWDNHKEIGQEIYDRGIRSDLNSYFRDYHVTNEYVGIHNEAVIELRKYSRQNDILNLELVFKSNPYNQNADPSFDIIRSERMRTHLGTRKFYSILVELYLSNQDIIQWMETLSKKNDLLRSKMLKYLD